MFSLPIKKEIDLRDVLLQRAGEAFINKTIWFEGKEYYGKEAVQKALALVDLVEFYDKKYNLH